MAVNPDEVMAVIEAASTDHRPEVMRLVTMHYLAESLMDGFGRANGVSLEPQIIVLDRVVRHWMEGHNITVAEKIAAMRALMAAGRVFDRPPGA